MADADAALETGSGSVGGVPRTDPDACCGLASGGAMIQQLALQTPSRTHQVHFLSDSLDICESPLNRLDLRSQPFLSGVVLIWGCWTTRC